MARAPADPAARKARPSLAVRTQPHQRQRRSPTRGTALLLARFALDTRLSSSARPHRLAFSFCRQLFSAGVSRASFLGLASSTPAPRDRAMGIRASKETDHDRLEARQRTHASPRNLVRK